MRILTVGPDAALVEVADASEALALATAARVAGVAATEIVPAARTVLFDGVDVAALESSLGELRLVPLADTSEVVEIPVRYDGPDLETVARAWGCDGRTVVQRHTALTFTATFCGFAPGFAYLSGLPSAWAVARLSSPRPRVPAGSVGLADSWCAVYPQASPGGWRLIGTTDCSLWDVLAEPPALLAPGTRVRFVER